jgi:hypothetical protein
LLDIGAFLLWVYARMGGLQFRSATAR